MTKPQVLIQIVGRAESDLKGAHDLGNVTEAIDRIGGSMLSSVARAFTEAGHAPTERGGGLGEWDCGAIVSCDDASTVLCTIQSRFRSAFRSGLLRWHVSVLCDDNQTAPVPGAGISTPGHPQEIGRKTAWTPQLLINQDSAGHDVPELQRRLDAVTGMIAKSLCSLSPDERKYLGTHADAVEGFIRDRRDRVLVPALYRNRNTPTPRGNP